MMDGADWCRAVARYWHTSQMLLADDQWDGCEHYYYGGWRWCVDCCDAMWLMDPSRKKGSL